MTESKIIDSPTRCTHTHLISLAVIVPLFEVEADLRGKVWVRGSWLMFSIERPKKNGSKHDWVETSIWSFVRLSEQGVTGTAEGWSVRQKWTVQSTSSHPQPATSFHTPPFFTPHTPEKLSFCVGFTRFFVVLVILSLSTLSLPYQIRGWRARTEIDKRKYCALREARRLPSDGPNSRQRSYVSTGSNSRVRHRAEADAFVDECASFVGQFPHDNAGFDRRAANDDKQRVGVQSATRQR